MHVTLINPPTISTPTTYAEEAVPPLGLAYVCAAVVGAGHDVEVIDAVGDGLDKFCVWSEEHRSMLRGLSFEELARRVPAHTDVIGVSAMFSNAWIPTRALVRRLAAARPGAVIVLGGEHATACHRLILATCPEVAYCVLGEGEDTFLRLLAALATDPAAAGTLDGVASRARPVDPPRLSRVPPGKRRPRIRDIASIAQPAWDRFPIERYVGGGHNHGVRRGRTMPILASRGCPYQCTFCSSPSMWTTRWAARRPRDVLDEMKRYIARYAVNDFAFYDLTAIVRRDWIIELCRAILDEGLDITWQLPSGTRSEAIDAEVAGLLYASGCRNMNYAPESGSPAVLARIKKRVQIPRLLSSVRSAVAAGIEVKVNIILGFPDETLGEVLETYRLLAALARAGVDAVSVFPFCPYPGSELFEQLVDRGTIALTDRYFDDLVYTDLSRVRSYNDNVGAGALSAQVLGALGVFHGVQALTHPARLASAVRPLVIHEQSSKIANAIEPMRRRKRVWRDLTSGSARGRT